MSQRNGAVIHVERGYQIAEVVDGDSVHGQLVGFRLIGKGAEGLPVFANENEAKDMLHQLAVRNSPRGPA